MASAQRKSIARFRMPPRRCMLLPAAPGAHCMFKLRDSLPAAAAAAAAAHTEIGAGLFKLRFIGNFDDADARAFLREHALLQYENTRSLVNVTDAEWTQIQEVRGGGGA